MSHDLESPYVEGVPDWDALYRARGEVSLTRPIFTGDVFTGVQLPGSTGKTKARSVVVLQHPCSMRTNGVDLAWQVLVAEVTNRKEIDEPGWTGGNFNLMPLPDIRPDVTTQGRHQAANFDNLYTVAPRQLDFANRLSVTVRSEPPSSALGALQLPCRGAHPHVPRADRCLLRGSRPDRGLVRRSGRR